MAYMLPRNYRIEGMTDRELQAELAMEQDPAIRDQYEHEIQMREVMNRDFIERQAQGEFTPEELATIEEHGLKTMSNDELRAYLRREQDPVYRQKLEEEAMERQRRDLYQPDDDAASDHGDSMTATPLGAGPSISPPSHRNKASDKDKNVTGLKADEEVHFETGNLDDHLALGKAVAIQIRDGSGHKTHGCYIHQPDDGVYEMRDPSNDHGFIMTRVLWFWQAVKDSLLPADPHSVSPDYWTYQFYDSAQAFCSTILSAFANKFVLMSLGVGDANTTPAYAVLLTLLKDSVSRTATVTFAWHIGLSVEQEAKYYRYIADWFNDLAIVLDLVAPFLEERSKIIAIVAAEALRALCGVAASSSKAALSHHFARGNNLAELNAKEASQETSTSLVALLVALWLGYVVTEMVSVVSVVIFFIAAHLYFNYCGIRGVALTVLNRQRATILMQHYLADGEVLTPKQVAEKEVILLRNPNIITDRRGQGAFDLAIARSYADMTADRHDNGDYIIAFNSHAGDIVSARIFITRRRDVGQENFAILKAWYHGVATAWQKSHMGWEANDLAHRDNFWRLAEEAGWKLQEQGIETGAPIRIWYDGHEEPRGGEKKDQ